MTPAYSANGIDYYNRKDDELKLGQANVDKIVYGFWQEKLYSVELSYTGYDNFISIKESVTARFGQSKQLYRFVPVFFWNGTRSAILLDHNNPGNRGKLLIYSKTMQKDKERQDQERAKRDAAKDF